MMNLGSEQLSLWNTDRQKVAKPDVFEVVVVVFRCGIWLKGELVVK